MTGGRGKREDARLYRGLIPRGWSGSEIQDTVKLPAESLIPERLGLGGGTDSVHFEDQRRLASICLVSLFMRFNIVIWHR